jgi:hypothetical protein
MAGWFAHEDWYARPFAFWGLTLIIAGRLAINQLRWWCLPFMRKPLALAARPDWKVGVASTFVPGAESIEMLERTVKALVALDYPHDTWVLDEGNDDRVKALCSELGAFHFSRKNFPHYQTEGGAFRSRSKHGNYNAWFHRILVDSDAGPSNSERESLELRNNRPVPWRRFRYLLPKMDFQRDSRSRLDDIANMRTIQAIYLGGKKFE